MAFLGSKTRKTAKPTVLISPACTPISVKYMTLTDGLSTVHFKRLGYTNCPGINTRKKHGVNEFRSDEIIIDMGRWDFVGEMYQVISGLDKSPRTKLNIFNALVALIKFCDKREIPDIFSPQAIELFVIDLKGRYLNGVKGSCSRNAGYPAPPAQTRTCGFPASGSSVVLAFAQSKTIMRPPSSAFPP